MMRRRALLALLAAATVLLALLILTDALPFLRGPAPGSSEWYWPYQLRPLSRWWAPLAAAIVDLALVGWWLSTRRQRLPLLGLMAGTILLQLALVYADRPDVWAELIDRALSNHSGGYFEGAVETEAINPLLANYPAAMPTFVSDHLRTHPPGLLLTHWLVTRLATVAPPALTTPLAQTVIPQRCADPWLLGQPLSTAAALGIWATLPLLVAAAAVWPAYALARQLMSESQARLATTLVATIPALLLFVPQTDLLFPFLTLTTFYFLQRGLNKSVERFGKYRCPRCATRRLRQLFYIFLAGLTLSLMTFLSLGNAALLLPILYLALQHRNTSPHPLTLSPPHLVTLSLFLAGLASLWLLYWAGWGVAPWEVARVGLAQHYELVNQYRHYAWWVIYDLVDLVLYAGLPLMVGFGLAFLAALHPLARSPLHSLSISISISILFLDLSGATRGEVGRIWLFFMPLLALPGGAAWRQRLSHRATWLIVALQLLLAVSLGLAWRPVQAVIVQVERPSMPAVTGFSPLVVQLDHAISLTGYKLDAAAAQPGGYLDLTLRWQANRPIYRPYTVFTHLTDETGTLRAQQDNWPVNGRWPPTCWTAGEVVVDPYRIELPQTLPPGRYQLLAGMYDAATGRRLAGPAGDALLLEEIMIGDTRDEGNP